MVFGQNLLLVAFVLLLDYVQSNSIHTSKKWSPECPIGFQLVQTKEKADSYCIRLKSVESFGDKFLNCADNKYTSKLYKTLNFTKPQVRLWAEFKTLYPGGPFIDWSYSDSTGNILTSTFEVNHEAHLGIEEELCTVIEPSGNLTAVRCTDEYQRFCIVKPYDDFDESTEGCEELSGYYRFWSPRATCLTHMTGVNGGSVRANWRQASELCQKHGGTLLQRGWRYANHPLLRPGGEAMLEPLGMLMTSADQLLWLNEEDGNKEVPESEWSFQSEQYSPATSLVALQQDSWKLVNSSLIFFKVVCERSIHLRNVSLNVTYKNDLLTLTVNDSSVDEKKLWCFTDSIIFYPSEVTVDRTDDTTFNLKPFNDGYYWCINADSKDFRVSESNRELVIRDKATVKNLYAIKIRAKRKYNFENLEKLLQIWSKKLSDYIFVRTTYKKRFGEDNLAGNNETLVLKEYQNENHSLDRRSDVLLFLKFRRVYLDGQTALLHGQMMESMEPVPPGFWEDLEVLFMKPAYYCKPYKSLPSLELGQSLTINCRKFACVGDFNEGVQLVETAVSGCHVIDAQPITVNATISFPTTTLPPPKGAIVSRAPKDLLRQGDGKSSEETNETTTEVIEPTTNEVIVEATTNVPVPIIKPEEEMVSVTNDLPTEVTDVDDGHCNRPYCRPTPPALPPPTVTATPIEPATPIIDVPFEQQLQHVIESLDQLLNDTSTTVNLEDINVAFDGVDELFAHTDESSIPGTLLRQLDAIGARANLNGSATATAIRSNVALLMADSSMDTPCRGMKILARDAEEFSEDAFEILTEEPNATSLFTNTSEAVVQLPESLLQSSRRVTFVVFRTDRAFSGGGANVSVNSRVLSINVQNLTVFDEGEMVELHFRPLQDVDETNLTRACAFWQFEDDGTGGHWSTEGCTLIKSDDPDALDTCRCDHLTHFAEILLPNSNFSEENELALEILSVIGCVTSLIGLFFVGLTAAIFRTWRREFSNKIWLQLCAAILILQVCFLIVVFQRFETYNIGCMIAGVLLHYSVLTSFCWMLVSAVISYRRLVLVFTRDASHKLMKAAAFSWGTPCFVIAILLSIDPQAYAGHFNDEYVGTSFCYPSGLALYLTVHLPIGVMLLANWTLFGLIVRSVFASRRIQRHGDSKEALRCASVSFLLVFLFGLPWVLGFVSNNIVMAYLFNITATFQGFVLFVFFVVGNKKTRDLWLNKLKIKQSRKVPVTSSTYKSSGGGWRGGSERQISIEANMSKPRSLASTDESRFS